MRKTILLVAVVVMICVMGISCGTLFTKGGGDYRSGVSAYEKQDYVNALQYLSQALAVNPELAEAALLFPKVFTEGTAFYKEQVAEYIEQTDPRAADRVVGAYERLQNLHGIARDSGRSGLALEDFSESLRAARIASADLWFATGEALRGNKDRESLRQAVVAYEAAKERNPAIQDIDALIADTLQKATVTIAVVANGWGIEGFSEMVLRDVTRELSGNRFVEVQQRHDFFPGEGSMVDATEIAIMEAMGKGWDYVLEVSVHQDFDEINREEPVKLPSEAPLFPGTKKTLGYQHRTSVFYRLFHIADYVDIVMEDQFKEVEGPYEYTFSFVPAEGLRELNFGTGKQNLRFVTSTVSDDVTDRAIGTLRRDYERIFIPSEIADPTHQTHWTSYFSGRYKDFRTLASNESGRELFYAIEVVHHKPSDTYFMIGSSLDEAVRQSKINSAIMNALHHTARSLINEAKKTGSRGYLKAGVVAANAIKHVL